MLHKAKSVSRKPSKKALAASAVAQMSDPVVTALNGAVDIRNGLAVSVLLKQAVAAGDAVDVSGVTHVDTAGLQLLIAATRSAKKVGKTLRWQGAPTVLVEAATKLGVAATLGLEPAV